MKHKNKIIIKSEKKVDIKPPFIIPQRTDVIMFDKLCELYKIDPKLFNHDALNDN